jgi:hypothetical protein
MATQELETPAAQSAHDPMIEIGSLLADLIVDQPIAVTTLLEQHVADEHGHCRTCTLGGQRGNQTWPCTIYAAAVIAFERGARDE